MWHTHCLPDSFCNLHTIACILWLQTKATTWQILLRNIFSVKIKTSQVASVLCCYFVFAQLLCPDFTRPKPQWYIFINFSIVNQTFQWHLLEKTKLAKLLKRATNAKSPWANCSDMPLRDSHMTPRCLFSYTSGSILQKLPNLHVLSLSWLFHRNSGKKPSTVLKGPKVLHKPIKFRITVRLSLL